MLLMQLNQAPYRAIVEVRNAIEPMISQLAATRITDDALAQLRVTMDAMRANETGDADFLRSNLKFHDIIASSSGNVVFAYLINSLLGILDGTVVGIDYPTSQRASILDAHEQIYDALAKRDEHTSWQLMRDHIDSFASYAQRKFPEVLDQTVTWDWLLP
jgi:DNA-binding FadR family transcriptional regulator